MPQSGLQQVLNKQNLIPYIQFWFPRKPNEVAAFDEFSSGKVSYNRLPKLHVTRTALRVIYVELKKGYACRRGFYFLVVQNAPMLSQNIRHEMQSKRAVSMLIILSLSSHAKGNHAISLFRLLNCLSILLCHHASFYLCGMNLFFRPLPCHWHQDEDWCREPVTDHSAGNTSN
jgi:hypothetical protein